MAKKIAHQTRRSPIGPSPTHLLSLEKSMIDSFLNCRDGV